MKSLLLIVILFVSGSLFALDFDREIKKQEVVTVKIVETLKEKTKVVKDDVLKVKLIKKEKR